MFFIKNTEGDPRPDAEIGTAGKWPAGGNDAKKTIPPGRFAIDNHFAAWYTTR